MNFKEQIDSINARLEEIEARKKEIRDSMDSMTSDELEERKKELEEIISEKKKLADERQNLLLQREDDLKKDSIKIKEKEKNTMNKRQSQLFVIGRCFRNKNITEEEMRALDTSVTTTAKTFVQATASLNGVNNGGVLIPTEVLFDLLKEDEALTPILGDVIPTAVAGMLNVPYRKNRTKAYGKAEGKAVNDGQWEWDALSLVVGKLQSQLRVDDTVSEMSDLDLGSYIISQLEQDLAEDWSSDVIYGTGASNHISGITNGLTATTGTDAMTVIETAMKKLTGKYRHGAKLYVAQDIYDSIVMAKDKNGAYVINPVNNINGVQSIFGSELAVDETLNSGEFIFGNVSKYYKLNLTAPLKVELERSATAGTTTYVCSQGGAGKAVPSAFIYGKVTASV